jgi:hypothetical protein
VGIGEIGVDASARCSSPAAFYTYPVISNAFGQIDVQLIDLRAGSNRPSGGLEAKDHHFARRVRPVQHRLGRMMRVREFWFPSALRVGNMCIWTTVSLPRPSHRATISCSATAGGPGSIEGSGA